MTFPPSRSTSRAVARAVPPVASGRDGVTAAAQGYRRRGFDLPFFFLAPPFDPPFEPPGLGRPPPWLLLTAGTAAIRAGTGSSSPSPSPPTRGMASCAETPR